MENSMVLWLAVVSLSVFSAVGCKPIVREEPASEEQYVNAIKRMRYIFRNLLDNGKITEARDIFRSTLYRGNIEEARYLLIEQMRGGDGTKVVALFESFVAKRIQDTDNILDSIRVAKFSRRS